MVRATAKAHVANMIPVAAAVTGSATLADQGAQEEQD